MQLYIDGYRTQNDYLVKTLAEAAYYYGYKLLGGRMFNRIIVDVKLRKDMYKKEKAYGYCSISGDVHKPREFEIEIDSSKDHLIQDMLIWLAHEFVHLKQFVKGELYDYEDGSVKWKSKVYRDGKVSYEDAPWEKEAYRLEYKLYEEFWDRYVEGEKNGNR